MKKEDYFGKFFLREGDLKPEEIDEFTCKCYKLNIKFLKHLKSIGLLFDNRAEAMMHYKCIMGAMKKPVDERVLHGPEPKKPRIYISGAISHLNYGERFKAFQDVERNLGIRGFEVFNPMKNGLPVDSTTAQHMRRDLSELTREDKPYTHIFMMKGWNHSAGCWTEFKTALAIGLEVMFEQIDRPIIFK